MKNKIRNIINHLYFLFWETVQRYSNKVKPPAEFFYKKAEISFINENDIEAINYLEKGCRIYPNDLKINNQLADYFILKKDWEKAYQALKRIFENAEKLDSVSYYRYAKALREIGETEKSKIIIDKGLSFFPKNKRLHIEAIETAICNKEWLKVKQHSELIEQFNHNISIKLEFKVAIVHQILGEYEKLNNFYNDPKKLENIQKRKNTKITLFDNGESRIEFYKLHKNTKKVCITFDSINITWKSQPFGYKFLVKENIDVIAVRRRKKDSYQQDLSIKDFEKTLIKLTGFYDRKIAYGFSLGGYSALYYGSSLNCEVLSLSPRNSTHPVYGSMEEKYEEFTHVLKQKKNPTIKPVIAYDPMNLMDNNYINHELMSAYPNGIFLKFPYAGHRIAPYFKQVGILKDIILKVLNGEGMPSYKYIDNRNSYQYLRVLGNKCLSRNKLNWALDLAEMALGLAPNNRQSNRLKIRALIKLGRLEEANIVGNQALEKLNEDKTISNILQSINSNNFVELDEFEESLDESSI